MIMPTGLTGWKLFLLTVRGDDGTRSVVRILLDDSDCCFTFFLGGGVMRWYVIGYATCVVLAVAFKVALVTAVVIGVASCVGVL